MSGAQGRSIRGSSAALGRSLAALALVLNVAPTAHAQPRSVLLALEDCLGAQARSVRRIVAAELGDDVLVQRDGDTPPGDHLVARADCGVESAIVVVQHARGVRFERRVELDEAPIDARARLLALSVVELVASAWAAVDALPPVEEAPPPVEQPEPEPPASAPAAPSLPPPPPEPAPPEAPTRPLGVRVMGVARVSGSPAHVSFGGGLGLEVALPLSLGVGADVRYEQGEASVGPLGRVTLRVAWGSLLALVRPVVGWSSLSIGLGAKLGVAWLEGTPGEPGVVGLAHSGLVAGPALVGHVALHVAGSGYVHLGLELAWITAGVAGSNAATGETLASFSGPQLAVTVGFEIQPSR